MIPIALIATKANYVLMATKSIAAGATQGLDTSIATLADLHLVAMTATIRLRIKAHNLINWRI